MNAKGAPPDELSINKELVLEIVSMPHFARKDSRSLYLSDNQ